MSGGHTLGAPKISRSIVVSPPSTIAAAGVRPSSSRLTPGHSPAMQAHLHLHRRHFSFHGDNDAGLTGIGHANSAARAMA